VAQSGKHPKSKTGFLLRRLEENRSKREQVLQRLNTIEAIASFDLKLANASNIAIAMIGNLGIELLP
jgi:hypothetical protein